MNGAHAQVLAMARAGATRRAWERFITLGLDRIGEDPAALTLKGRLLKDQARKARGEAAARLYLQSAKAYAAAAARTPDSYPLINAATMSLFAGQPDHMALLAQKVLTMLDSGIGVGETAYWHEATRAEALLLLGRSSDARAALDKAIVMAPAAWEDRAATLQQFRQISAFRGEASEWLAGYAPPASLYFKGMIGVALGDIIAPEIARKGVADAGFGYGALAAGADILIAEALVGQVAELHLVLPVMASAFRAQSVAPFGEAWLPRFDRLFEQAASVTIAADGEQLTDAAIAFAAQVAKGMALENARRLEGRAAGLELNDEASPTFDAANDTLLTLERSAALPPTRLPKGQTAATLVSDFPDDDPKGWTRVADGFQSCTVASIKDAHAMLGRARENCPDARYAIVVTADEAGVIGADDHLAKVLRLAQCAPPGTAVADARSARALLSLFPDLRIEPLGELPDATGATGIYAIEPLA